MLNENEHYKIFGLIWFEKGVVFHLTPNPFALITTGLKKITFSKKG